MTTVVISGASGFIGARLCAVLAQAGTRVRPLVRPGRSQADGIAWDPVRHTIDLEALEGVDAVVHLAGEGIAQSRWTAETKARIRESRVLGTSLLAGALAKLTRKPSVFVSASAIGYYGDCGDAPIDEGAKAGHDFLAQVCEAWEEAATPARAASIRVVHPRIGVVLDPSGGALSKMLVPFKIGAGGRIGDGRQVMSWISLHDAVRALVHCVDSALSGPVNLTAPNPVTNAELTRALARALKRPALLPLPAFAARLALGEMADTALLAGARVLPQRLLDSGFSFAHPTLQAFLADSL
jgi:hypothetical protein